MEAPDADKVRRAAQALAHICFSLLPPRPIFFFPGRLVCAHTPATHRPTTTTERAQDPIKVQIHDKQVEELERSLDPPLNVLFIRQLLTLRDKARTYIHTYVRL